MLENTAGIAPPHYGVPDMFIQFNGLFDPGHDL